MLWLYLGLFPKASILDLSRPGEVQVQMSLVIEFPYTRLLVKDELSATSPTRFVKFISSQFSVTHFLAV